MERIETREMISALADGQLQGDAFARGVELAAGESDAREAWHAYHLIGDVLRSADLAVASPPGPFLARLQARLREEPTMMVAPPAQQPAPLARVAPAQLQAANDGSFRWKVVAGCASVAAAAAIGWTLMGGGGKSDAPQLAAVPAGGGSERGVMIRDARLDELLAAHRQLGAAMVAPAGHLRNAGLDSRDR